MLSLGSARPRTARRAPARPGGRSPLRGRRARSARAHPQPAGWRAREGRFRDSCDALRVPFKTLNALKGTLKTPGHVPKPPLARRALRAWPAKRASPGRAVRGREGGERPQALGVQLTVMFELPLLW